MEDQPGPPLKSLNLGNINKIFIGVLVMSVVLGVVTGYMLRRSGSSVAVIGNSTSSETPKTAQQDTRTFRDFAEGKIQKRPEPKNEDEYLEGTHLLVREGAVPVALTSSVIDLSQYEGKQVKVFGETQKAVKEGWLMDAGKVEVK